MRMLGQVYCIAGHKQRDWFVEQVAQITVPEFQVNSNARVPQNDKEEKLLATNTDPAQLQQFDQTVSSLPSSNTVLCPASARNSVQSIVLAVHLFDVLG